MTAPLLHVVGAGPWQLATIRRAKGMGLRVFATDGLADRPGYAVADRSEVADITDAESTLSAARRHQVDGVLCDTTDTGVYTAAYVADRLSLPGIGLEAARRCTDKAAMTGALRDAGLRVPRSCPAASLDEAAAAARTLGFPVVVKPVDNQGGRGVGIVRDSADLPTAYAAALACSRSGRVIVQEFLCGTEVIVDSLVVDRRVFRLGVARKAQFDDNPTISRRITYGASAASPSVEAIDAINAAVIEALGIRQGLVHAEYLIDDNGAAPVDVAARGGGVMIYPVVLPHVSGVDAMDAAIRLALGETVIPVPLPRPRAANIEFLRVPPGRITAIEGVETARAMPGIAAAHLFHGVGNVVRPLRDKEDRLGFVVALANAADEAIALSQRAASVICTSVTPIEGNAIA